MSKAARTKAFRQNRLDRKAKFAREYGELAHRNDPKWFRSNRTSYNYTQPGAYQTKDERPYATNDYGRMVGPGTRGLSLGYLGGKHKGGPI